MSMLAALAAILLSAAVGGVAGSTAGAAEGHKGTLNDGSYKTNKTWFGQTDNSTIGAEFRAYAKANGAAGAYLDSLTDQELGSLLKNSYLDKGYDALGFGSDSINFVDALQDFNEIQGMQMPQMPDYEQIYQNAADTISKENAEVQALYDEALSQQLADLNNSYKDTAQQILSNDYIKNQQLMDAATSELSKSRRNALEAGASAGLRLANNVNTMLSVQNRQTQQSLETSNNLAQMMLNQRQAAAGFRNDYYNNTANLKQGTAERTANYAGTQVGLEESKYQNQKDSWQGAYGTNPFYGNRASFLNQQNQKNKNNYYGG